MLIIIMFVIILSVMSIIIIDVRITIIFIMVTIFIVIGAIGHFIMMLLIEFLLYHDQWNVKY